MEVDAEFAFELGKAASLLYKSLYPELGDAYQRTSVELKAEGNVVTLKLIAKDIISMRAALNGWLRLIKVAWEMAEIRFIEAQV